MKTLVIGDPLLSSEKLKIAVHEIMGEEVEVCCVDWKPANDEEFWYLRSIVEKNGPSVGKPPQEIFDYVGEVDMIITQHTPINEQIIEAAKKCKVIGVCRAGVENIDVTAATKHGIPVCRTMGRNANAVSDYTVALMITEMRNIGRGHAALKQGEWKKQYSNYEFVGDMYGKTVGLVGFGYIGHCVAKKLKGFDVNILVYDPFVKAEEIEAQGCKLVSLEELCEKSDFISMHARLSDETRGLIGTAQFELMKPTAYIINTARAGLIDEQALIAALQDKKIGGAAIDVWWVEPPAKNHPFMTLDNVTITPHLAGSTKDAFNRTPYLLLEEIKRTAQEGKPRWIVNAKDVSVELNTLQ
ncbi:2-hydroxyacid dehydrogenase [Megasphaera paucivorans]|uniref:D-3-phosphoglycerate dehydrogenase n=1 Tax=Megasphaera paucivorans TaxID=349095 RepID=A0A1G9R1A7_9FIRM|nr:2-hydroxyacid dehydrogenase [Megasphaera paucivorans]SDM16235.1 D-3-phosphoglycerate dehydrogenase [Megasphaera paucivorans]